jgi:type II secretory pathway component PulK
MPMDTIRDRGSILVVALWLLFLLALLAAGVGAHVNGRLELARRLEQRWAAQGAARAGVERGIAWVQGETNGWDSLDEPWANQPGVFSNGVMGAGWFAVVRRDRLASGDEAIRYGMGDEQGRIDLNLGRVELLQALFETAGGLGAEQAAKVAAALAQARTRPEGPPSITGDTGWVDRRLERGPLLSVHELRWVKGVTPALFEGVQEHVTVHGGARVNLNTAGVGVLTALGHCAGRGGKDREAGFVRKILQFRGKGGIFKTYLGPGVLEALGAEARLTEDERAIVYGLAPYVTVTSDRFRGHVEGGSVQSGDPICRIDFVWNRSTCRIEYWHED